MRSFFPFILVLFTTLFLGCHSKNDQLPWDKQKTIDIFTEAQLIESKLSTIKNKDEKDSLSYIYYHFLFEKYETDKEEFEQVFDYYAQRPEKMETMYADIITQLTLMSSQPDTKK